MVPRNRRQPAYGLQVVQHHPGRGQGQDAGAHERNPAEAVHDHHIDLLTSELINLVNRVLGSFDQAPDGRVVSRNGLGQKHGRKDHAVGYRVAGRVNDVGRDPRGYAPGPDRRIACIRGAIPHGLLTRSRAPAADPAGLGSYQLASRTSACLTIEESEAHPFSDTVYPICPIISNCLSKNLCVERSLIPAEPAFGQTGG